MAFWATRTTSAYGGKNDAICDSTLDLEIEKTRECSHLREVRRLSRLVLGDLMHCMLHTFPGLAISSPFLGHVHHLKDNYVNQGEQAGPKIQISVSSQREASCDSITCCYDLLLLIQNTSICHSRSGV